MVQKASRTVPELFSLDFIPFKNARQANDGINGTIKPAELFSELFTLDFNPLKNARHAHDGVNGTKSQQNCD